MTFIKYKNRKIYWVDRKRYTTLKELFLLLSMNVFYINEVRVIDFKTKNDITPQVLSAMNHYALVHRY